MKATAQVLPHKLSVSVDKPWLVVLADLFKARLTTLVLLTTMVGFYLGAVGGVDAILLAHTVAAMALLAGGGAAINQWIEREHDARMHRTQDRPLPSGRMQPQTVLLIGWACAISGAVYFWLAVNWLSGVLGIVTFLVYAFAYTPLKRVTWLNTLVGAIPGAMPPLIGWTAARGEIGLGGVALFAIQAFWQIPHFMAIAWMYRDEYAKAGFRMLPAVDPLGRRTSFHSLICAAALLVASLVPYFMGLLGPIYLVSAVVMGLGFVWFAAVFKYRLTLSRARQLFFASIVYLPLLLSAMVLDKVNT